MASVQLLRPADYRVMPWKNGLGTTTEIAVDPPGAGLDDFTWRISIADVGASGPFSTFAGCDRILVQVEGAPMVLSSEGGGERLQLLSPYGFAGEIATYAALEAPPARDFNVMVRRDRASAEVLVRELASGDAVRTAGEVATRVLHALRGSVVVEVDSEASAVVGGETLVAREAATLLATAASEVSVVIIVTLGAPRG